MKQYGQQPELPWDSRRREAPDPVEPEVVKTSFTFKLTPEQQATLTAILRTGNYRPKEVPYTSIAVESAEFNVALFTSGKCLVQGKGARDFVTFVLEPQVLKEVKLGYEEMLNPEAFEPHMGVDESGKGDFFGPLVIASAYADRDLTKTMEKMGVKDSKNISTDKRALDLARDLRKLLGNRYSIVPIGPAAYNRLYLQMRSVNRILAWGHARAIENLLGVLPDCPRAISDQFGSKEQVEKALMQRGKGIELVQRHRAESDMAVAAASILARGAFLDALKKLGETHGVKMLKGASDKVRESAVELVKKKGGPVLLETAKCHFKTTDQVLKEAGLTRAVLGREGSVVSRPSKFHHRPHGEKPPAPAG
ncbi:MAG: ribonuclease HIII [Lentisphaerae bacterium]|nr:ribonuclease HIII [Lentisphaerota bacterium]